MRICIIGAGAIGGMLGAGLACAGETVTFVEKNRRHADAIRSDGLRVERDGETTVARNVAVTESFAEAQQIGEKLGIAFRHTIEKRIAGAQAVGEHKTTLVAHAPSGL